MYTNQIPPWQLLRLSQLLFTLNDNQHVRKLLLICLHQLDYFWSISRISIFPLTGAELNCDSRCKC